MLWLGLVLEMFGSLFNLLNNYFCYDFCGWGSPPESSDSSPLWRHKWKISLPSGNNSLCHFSFSLSFSLEALHQLITYLASSSRLTTDFPFFFFFSLGVTNYFEHFPIEVTSFPLVWLLRPLLPQWDLQIEPPHSYGFPPLKTGSLLQLF